MEGSNPLLAATAPEAVPPIVAQGETPFSRQQVWLTKQEHTSRILRNRFGKNDAYPAVFVKAIVALIGSFSSNSGSHLRPKPNPLDIDAHFNEMILFFVILSCFYAYALFGDITYIKVLLAPFLTGLLSAAYILLLGLELNLFDQTYFPPYIAETYPVVGHNIVNAYYFFLFYAICSLGEFIVFFNMYFFLAPHVQESQPVDSEIRKQAVATFRKQYIWLSSIPLLQIAASTAFLLYALLYKKYHIVIDHHLSGATSSLDYVFTLERSLLIASFLVSFFVLALSALAIRRCSRMSYEVMGNGSP